MATKEDRDAAQAASLPEPETFDSGRYVVRQLLGEGVQKTVYLVHDTQLGRDCALSLLKTEDMEADDLALQRNEAQTMARLTHGNIVTVHDISEETEEQPYIVAEFVPGGDLRQVLRETGGPLPPRRVIAIAKDVCRALTAAHRSGVIHRDVKPANIWLAEDGSAKLGDFGIARGAGRSGLTMTDAMLRTAAYMTPEQAQGKEVTTRSDLYSLGCVLYELLTGRPPFEGDDPMAIVAQHVAAQPVPLRERNEAVPESLARLVLRLLEKAPDSRPASAEEVLAELERIEVAVPATEPSRPARALALLLARPAFRIGAVVLLLVAIGGGVAGVVVLSGGGGESAAATEVLEFSVFFEGPGEVVSGDCITEDLVVRFTVEGAVSGDIVGRDVSTLDTIVYAGCTEGTVRFSSTFTDADGNSLSFTSEGPLSLSGLASTSELAVTVIGGSGRFEGTTGGGSCTSTSEAEAVDEGGFLRTGRNDCQLELTND